MHSKGLPKNMQKNPQYKNCLQEVFEFLSKQKEFALSFGIKQDFISVDPGIGFGKSVQHNLELIKNLKSFSCLAPITVGVSRKSFVSKISGASPISFVAANLISVINGADIIRVHDAKETVEVLRMI
jgi:dihydropteroate synthase